MSILLTHGYFLQEDEIEKKIMMPYPPLGLLSISAFLDRNKVEHKVFDTSFSTEQDWFDYVFKNEFKIIAFYCNFLTKPKILKLIKKLKSFEELKTVKVAIGGPDVTYNWENYLAHGADYLIIGEGEETFLEFIKQFYSEQEYHKVQGLAFIDKKGGKRKNPGREKNINIDELPIPNYSKIDINKYLQVWKNNHGRSRLNISSQRGCPYNCQWCSKSVYGRTYRRKSPSLLVDEIEYLKKEFNPDALWFTDDVFTISHKWVSSFAEEMKKRRINIPFECITRAEKLNDDILKLLKSAGCFRIWIGAESGSQRIIELMQRQADIQDVCEKMNLTKQYGIETGTFIMLGYPTETKEDIKLTLEYLKNANPDHFTITVAYPIKGTGLYKQTEAYLTHKPDWHLSTDRQIDYKRSYSRRYYDHAVRRLTNEINFNKEKLKGKSFSKQALKYKVKSIISMVLMQLKS